MTKQQWVKIERLVDKALIRPESERTAFIYKVCKTNPELRQEVLVLLSAIKESEGWLQNFCGIKRTILHPD